mgnify:CR=1 FL=1
MYRRELFENDKPSRLERFLEAGVFFTGMIGWGGLLAEGLPNLYTVRGGVHRLLVRAVLPLRGVPGDKPGGESMSAVWLAFGCGLGLGVFLGGVVSSVLIAANRINESLDLLDAGN